MSVKTQRNKKIFKTKTQTQESFTKGLLYVDIGLTMESDPQNEKNKNHLFSIVELCQVLVKTQYSFSSFCP